MRHWILSKLLLRPGFVGPLRCGFLGLWRVPMRAQTLHHGMNGPSGIFQQRSFLMTRFVLAAFTAATLLSGSLLADEKDKQDKTSSRHTPVTITKIDAKK